MEPKPEEEKKEQKVEKGNEMPLIIGTMVMVREEKTVKEEEKEENQWWMLVKKHWTIALALIAIGIAILGLTVYQYNQYKDSTISGSYTVDRNNFYLSQDDSYFIPGIDDDFYLRVVISNTSNGDVRVNMSLMTKDYTKVLPKDVQYEIDGLTIRGKKSKWLPIRERLVQGTNIVGTFSPSIEELGNTLTLEIEASRENTTANFHSPFFYRVEILRESSGKIYYVKEKDGSMKQEPGFEAFLLIAALVIAVAIRKRK